MLTGRFAQTGFWTDHKDLIVDPARAGNLLRFINDYVGIPGGVTCSAHMVEVIDRATLRPHIFCFTFTPVRAGTEILLDYGDVSFLLGPFHLSSDTSALV